MSGDILNIALHESEAPTVVNWMLWRWGFNPKAKLLVITHEGDGPALDNRIRVFIATARTTMRKQGMRDYTRFGFATSFSAWETLNGMRFDAVYIERFVHPSHVMSAALASLGIDFDIKKEPNNGRR